MPHKHSQEVHATRSARAVVRCFWTPRQPVSGHVLVPTRIAEPFKAMVKALIEHDKIDSLTMCEHRFLAHAALAARPVLGLDEVSRVLRINKAAGKAKHSFRSTLSEGPS